MTINKLKENLLSNKKINYNILLKKGIYKNNLLNNKKIKIDDKYLLFFIIEYNIKEIYNLPKKYIKEYKFNNKNFIEILFLNINLSKFKDNELIFQIYNYISKIINYKKNILFYLLNNIKEKKVQSLLKYLYKKIEKKQTILLDDKNISLNEYLFLNNLESLIEKNEKGKSFISNQIQNDKKIYNNNKKYDNLMKIIQKINIDNFNKR